jgi:glucosamine-6-phosphate deaminase
VRVIVEQQPENVSRWAAAIVSQLIRRKPNCVLGLATGSTPLGLYRELIRMHQEEGLDFSRVTTFNLDEYVGLGANDEHSYRYFMQSSLFDHININPQNTNVPDGRALDFEKTCELYEKKLRDAGGIDLQVLGIGSDGHIAFNEPGSSLGSRTRLKTLTSERCLLLAIGASKAKAIRDAIEGPMTAQVTASALQLHRDVLAVIDEEAGRLLERRDYYREVERAQVLLEAGKWAELGVATAPDTK